MTGPLDFDGCNRECRQAGAHTLRWGSCEHAAKPERTVSISRVYTASDGQSAIGFDTHTLQQLADLIAPVLLGELPPGSESYGRYLALRAAEAIITRNDGREEAS